jgi:hypothetical protein
MNRIRKTFYLEVSRFRRQTNGVPLCEPKDLTSVPASCESACRLCSRPKRKRTLRIDRQISTTIGNSFVWQHFAQSDRTLMKAAIFHDD